MGLVICCNDYLFWFMINAMCDKSMIWVWIGWRRLWVWCFEVMYEGNQLKGIYFYVNANKVFGRSSYALNVKFCLSLPESKVKRLLIYTTSCSEDEKEAFKVLCLNNQTFWVWWSGLVIIYFMCVVMLMYERYQNESKWVYFTSCIWN
jgi:hypothetical protein